MRLVHGFVAALILTGGAWSTTASAQTVVTQPPAQLATGEIIEYEGPNRSLLVSGMLTFMVPYLASVGVGVGSKHPGDNKLLVPVAGPWLDLDARPACHISRTNSCDTETTNQVLLVGDGILQGLGALQLVGAFLFPEREVISTTIAQTPITPKMTLSPAKIGNTGYGLFAVGTF